MTCESMVGQRRIECYITVLLIERGITSSALKAERQGQRMDKEIFGHISLIERAKIQAEVLVPVLKAFRAELGEERANRIAWQALAQWRRETARAIAAELPGSPREKWQAAMEASRPIIGDSVDFDVLKQSEDAFDFNITGCRFAEFFRQLGEPELGFALLCSFDDAMAEEIGTGEVELKRTGTIMQGAQHCDFRYALRRRGTTR